MVIMMMMMMTMMMMMMMMMMMILVTKMMMIMSLLVSPGVYPHQGPPEAVQEEVRKTAAHRGRQLSDVMMSTPD